MVEETTRQVLPTATGFAAREAIAALRKHHVEPGPLLRRAGISEHDLTLAESDTEHGVHSRVFQDGVSRPHGPKCYPDDRGLQPQSQL